MWRDFATFHALMKQSSQNADPRSRHGRRARDRVRPARRLGIRDRCGFLSLLWSTIGALQWQQHAGPGAFRTMAFGHRSDAGLLSKTSAKFRTRQANLADGNRGCRLRRKPVGRDLPGCVPRSRSVGGRESRRSGCHAQHAGGGATTACSMSGPCSCVQNTGRAALAAIDGNHRARYAGQPVQSGLHVYAHCQRDKQGGVALLAINTPTATHRTRWRSLPPWSATRWTRPTCWMRISA